VAQILPRKKGNIYFSHTAQTPILTYVFNSTLFFGIFSRLTHYMKELLGMVGVE